MYLVLTNLLRSLGLSCSHLRVSEMQGLRHHLYRVVPELGLLVLPCARWWCTYWGCMAHISPIASCRLTLDRKLFFPWFSADSVSSVTWFFFVFTILQIGSFSFQYEVYLRDGLSSLLHTLRSEPHTCKAQHCPKKCSCHLLTILMLNQWMITWGLMLDLMITFFSDPLSC